MGDGGDERLAVGVQRHCPQLAGRSGLGDHPQVHDRDGVGHVADDGEIVRDEQEPDFELARELDQEVRDLCLRRSIERGQRLVENDDGRVRGERARDGYALPLATRELVRITAGGGIRQPYLLEELRRSVPARWGREARPRTASASPICSPTLRRGLSEENGFWKTICSRTSS